MSLLKEKLSKLKNQFQSQAQQLDETSKSGLILDAFLEYVSEKKWNSIRPKKKPF